ncbi:hypothetical protein XA68_10803 [Ophiocordyceps unilateralis]|uniref:Uncharacterized protein n=1 Tax=Ophiocordyceps unilateralis TaxID=268505 RepID=A0A2A9P2F7_OPHUN|nr:hypothetical protein XA68_10803 [Ophiocordyceps unilateralis]
MSRKCWGLSLPGWKIHFRKRLGEIRAVVATNPEGGSRIQWRYKAVQPRSGDAAAAYTLNGGKWPATRNEQNDVYCPYKS